MGKLTVILVAGLTFIVATVGVILMKKNTDAHERGMKKFEQAQAQNVTKSAGAIVRQELRKNKDLAGTRQYNLLGGQGTVVISEKNPGDRQLLGLAMKGKYGAVQRQASIEATSPEAAAPTITGALGVSYLSKAKLNFGKGTVIDGNNHNPDGTVNASVSAIAGLSLGHPDQMNDLNYKPKDAKIKGKGSVEPNIEVQQPQPDYYEWAMRLALGADVTFNAKDVKNVAVLGTPDQPQVTYVKGNTKFNETACGAGILIIDGNCKFNKRFEFVGLVFVVGDSLTNEKATMGKGSSITGAMMVAGKKTQVKTGDVDILYSDAAVRRGLGLVESHMTRAYTYSNWNE